jgi:hypothetical protein
VLRENVSRGDGSRPHVLFVCALGFSAFLGGLARDRNLPQLKKREQHQRQKVESVLFINQNIKSVK